MWPLVQLDMASIQKNNRAAALLAALADEDRLSMERLAILAGVNVRDLQKCRAGEFVLELDVQVRLARVIEARVARLAPLARRLEEQATAALRVQHGLTALHLVAPAKWR